MNKMAQRMIRTGLLDSEKVNSLAGGDSPQMFFVRLMLIADDYGHCDARPIYIRSKCYPVSEVSVEKVEKLLQLLEQARLIWFYEIKGKRYLEIYDFGQRLRTMRYVVPCPQNAAESRNVPPEEKGSRKEEEENNTPLTWRTDYNIYKQSLKDAFAEIAKDDVWLKDREYYHPSLDVSKTLEKAIEDFWGTEDGWNWKKKSKTIKEINWLRTFNNALTNNKNKVWKPRGPR